MTGLDRRALLLLAGAGATGALLPASARGAAPAAAFAPQAGPLLLTRRLERDLRGGAQIVVTRTWRIAFSPGRTGFTVDGAQQTVTVDVPPPLAALAAVERERTEAMFPLALDRTGVIVSEAADAPSAEIDRALAEVRRTMAATSPGAAALAAQLITAGSRLVTHLPADLFAPRLPAWQEERAIALPDGGSGIVRVQYTAEAGRGGLLKCATRTVVTQVGESARESRENWCLDPPG